MRSRTRLSAVIVAGVVVVGGSALAAAALGSDDGGGSAGTTAAGEQNPQGGEVTTVTPHHAPPRPGTPPSETAQMVCGDEIHGDVASTFKQQGLAAGVSTWSGGRLFTCTYRLPQGDLVLSVKDSLSLPGGRAYFNAVRAFDGRPALLTGLQAFGLPSYETTDGKVVFLKDGKTLVVDAGALHQPVGPNGESRSDVAYAIAADVIGCWNE